MNTSLDQYKALVPPTDAIPLTMLVTLTPACWPFWFPSFRVMAPQITESGPQLQRPMMNNSIAIPNIEIQLPSMMSMRQAKAPTKMTDCTILNLQ